MPGTKKDWDHLYGGMHKRVPKHENPIIILPILIAIIAGFIIFSCGS